MPSDSSISPDSGAPSVGAVDADAWNALNRDDNPFTDHRFLATLEASGCVGGDTGWRPAPFANPASGACAPAWLKFHSHGEFVFDFAWAEAAHRAGLRWYPKLLVAAPLTPVTGPRLLGRDSAARASLVRDFEAFVEDGQLSGCGINFCDAVDRQTLDPTDWLERFDWQFHWHNRGYRDFDAFLAELRSKPRKNIRRERRLAHEDGWRYRWIDGNDIDDTEIETVANCYQTTFALYGNLPSLNRRFFEAAARAFGAQFLVCMASQAGKDLACSVFWRNDTRLYGRYWGSLVETRDVHFEACYYQGIEYCIEHGLQAFEPGAQGEHKIKRGFVPIKTHSYHYIRHPALREAIQRWLEMEGRALDAYRDDLKSIEPYREAMES
ncbi:MAG: GNAT family N-acetyltransferase [Ahrensia sp.]|nr:GNAT family N-acetyltransferase [Ahrensia sp.]|tara:strand:- start:662 stop:1804 length:1143 start_codon:yes stop_codon:yes gene_type:complete